MAKLGERLSPLLIGHWIRAYVFEPWSSQGNHLKIDNYCFQARSSALRDLARTGWLRVRIMRLSGISGHGAAELVFSWGSDIPLSSIILTLSHPVLALSFYC